MLGEEDAAAVDELDGGFLLKVGAEPGVGEGHFHGGGGADAAGAEEEGGVAGLDLGVGVGADVADLGLVGGDLALLDHLVELHARGDAAEVAALKDGRERVVEVGQAGGVGLGAGGVAELDVGELLGGLDHEGLVAEGVGEDDGAAGVDELGGLVVALLTLGDVGLDDVLDAAVFTGLLGGVHEVEVVGRGLVVQEDEADLDLLDLVAGEGADVEGGGVVVEGEGGLGRGLGLRFLAAGGEGEDHGQGEDQSDDLFHVCLLFMFSSGFLASYGPGSSARGGNVGRGGRCHEGASRIAHGSVRAKKTALARTIGARYQCKYPRGPKRRASSLQNPSIVRSFTASG